MLWVHTLGEPSACIINHQNMSIKLDYSQHQGRCCSCLPYANLQCASSSCVQKSQPPTCYRLRDHLDLLLAQQHIVLTYRNWPTTF